MATRSSCRIFPPRCARASRPIGRSAAGFALPEEGVDLEEVELDLVRQALDRAGGNVPKAAKLLGLTARHSRLACRRFGL